MVAYTCYTGVLTFNTPLSEEELTKIREILRTREHANCKWELTKNSLVYDDEDKHERCEYTIIYKIISTVLIPNGIIASGTISFFNDGDCVEGEIDVEDNVVKMTTRSTGYSAEETVKKIDDTYLLKEISTTFFVLD